MDQIQTRNTVSIPLTDLNIPPKDKMPRIQIDFKIVQQYAELIRDGYNGFPPIEIWQNSEKEWWIVGGIHRYKAAVKAGKESILCQIEEFPEEQFFLKAYVANVRHGFAYDDKTKKRGVSILYQQGFSVKEIHGWSNIPERTIRRWIKPLRDEKQKELDAKVRELTAQGRTQQEIAERLDVSRSRVSEIQGWIVAKQNMIPDSTKASASGNSGISCKNNEEVWKFNLECLAAESPAGHIQQGGNVGQQQADCSTMEPGKGEMRPMWRRHLKEAPIDEIKLARRHADNMRGWVTDVKRGSYDKVTVGMLHECSRKNIILGNELLLAIREFLEKLAELEQKPGLLPAGMTDNRYAEIDTFVKDFMRKNWSRIQGMPEEDRKDLEMDCLLDALEAQRTWDETKSSLRTWINNNLDWNFKDLAKKEHKRIQTMAEYRKHVQSLTTF